MRVPDRILLPNEITCPHFQTESNSCNQMPNPKKTMVYGVMDPMPELTMPHLMSTIQSRLQHIYHGQPCARVDLNPICQSQLYPPVRVFEFGLSSSNFVNAPSAWFRPQTVESYTKSPLLVC
jgi:hypothetical protein